MIIQKPHHVSLLKGIRGKQTRRKIISFKMKIYEIQDRNTQLLTALLNIWEDSVRATHFFLSDSEVGRIKKIVPQALKNVTNLIIAENEFGKPIAFMGIQNNRLEMLFVFSLERGKGIGKQLLQYGICNYAVREVTVNEQNPQAIGFYENIGFKIYKRTDHDEEGNPYPLLYMKL